MAEPTGRRVADKAITVLSKGYVCDSCLGRCFAELLSGMTNSERGSAVRRFLAFVADSGDKSDVDVSNFSSIRFRNFKAEQKGHGKCRICGDFFPEGVEKFAKAIVHKTSGYEYGTFLVGTVTSPDIAKVEESLWQEAGVDFVEPIKNEINREVGKRVEALSGKKFDLKSPDITAVIDMEKESVNIQVKSLYVFGKYQKLSRGIPQTEWFCRECKGKGCPRCEGVGKMYTTSVQGIVEKPLIKAAKAKKSKFHGAGREDIDARCLGKRPFIIELLRPMVRTIDLRRLEKEINRSRSVKVYGLKYAMAGDVEMVKDARHDKTYFAAVEFEKPIDKKTLGLVKKLRGATIMQRTPQRVVHRRANLTRDRKVKNIAAKAVGRRKAEFTITGEAGLYIKELLSGDNGRTQPNVADIIGNKVKNIKLDVIRIHDEKRRDAAKA